MACGINGLAVAHVFGLDLRLAASAIAWSTAIVLVAASGAALCDVGWRAVRALVQRVSRAAVRVGGEVAGAIGAGLLVLLGVTHDDDEAICDRLADKVRALRIFEDAEGRMNEPLGERAVLVREPVHALRRRAQGQPPELRRRRARRSSPSRSTSASASAWARARGVFGAHMEVELVNDGPVTLLLETPSA